MSKPIMAYPAIAATVLAAACAAAAQPSGNIQLALDKLVEFDIPNAPVDTAFEQLSRKTAVKFVIDPSVYECMPYGDQTRLGMKVKGYTLREALSPMLGKQAMEWIVDNDTVRVLPAPALLRMARRATYKELEVLGLINSLKAQPPGGETGDVLEQLRKAAGNKDLAIIFHASAAQADKEVQAEAVRRANTVLPGTPASWLDFLCHGRGWTWYLWGDSIMVVEKARQVERQLQRQVSLRYDNADLTTVLLDLARQARVKLSMDPGVMDLLPAETRTHFNLRMTEATIDQALEVIGGATGLRFVREPDGLRVQASERLPQASAGSDSTRQRPPFYVKKSLTMPDGSTVELLLRPDELPEDVQEAIKAERDKLFELLIKKYRPTTRPATQPAR